MPKPSGFPSSFKLDYTKQPFSTPSMYPTYPGYSPKSSIYPGSGVPLESFGPAGVPSSYG